MTDLEHLLGIRDTAIRDYPQVFRADTRESVLNEDDVELVLAALPITEEVEPLSPTVLLIRSTARGMLLWMQVAETAFDSWVSFSANVVEAMLPTRPEPSFMAQFEDTPILRL